MKVDLNCDMGESFGMYQLGNDEEMMPYITSANIACGYHGGDPGTMRRTVELAKEYNVQIGAHPGFPDLMGFGRRYMHCNPSEIKDYITYQVGALKAFAGLYDMPIAHCKPHGALYMMAMEDEKIARAILEGIVELDDNIIVFAMNNSAVAEAGEKMGVRIARETYSDREHTETGSIILTRKGSEIDDYDAMADRVVRMVKEGKVTAHSGEEADVVAETVCIHADTPGAVKLAEKIRRALLNNGIEISAIR
ncbi:lactam utilization protein LamB [Alteribacter lacisalsi]|uniref:5-oxoprolinase subunit A n=1 Tax=Alteribacter lacisalsi TaxID=2045244 RepID=A0A2W0H9X8_9BACI|nr:5-oxoprolinase subunit PxpA [Alteribacter lacisalsi]PYZ96860.1 lactam utilization protein LamB [Alteribacter lacisalsi]